MLSLDEDILCRHCAVELDALAWTMEQALVDERFDHLDHVWTVYAYRSPLRELLHGVKYGRKDYLLKACRKRAAGIAQAITSDFWYDAVLPVPIDRLKRVSRHYNQSEVLAEMLAPWITPPVDKSLLIKRRPIPSQTSLSQHERSINVYGAFALRNPLRATDRTFLLLDDVLTTGATADEAARLLKIHGARRVDFLALAKTVTPGEQEIVAPRASPEKQFEIPPPHG